MFDPAAYHISIKPEPFEDDICYVGKVLELPDVAVYEESFDSAYSSLISIIIDLKKMAESHGRPFPQPQS